MIRRAAPGAALAGTRNETQEEILAVLRRYVSEPTAQSILNLARRRAGITTTSLEPAHLRDLLEPIAGSLRFFMADPRRVDDCLRVLGGLNSAAAPSPPTNVLVAILSEEDIARARAESRNAAMAQGFTVVGQTRLVTAVSELSRNIVQYAGKGEIEFRALNAPGGVEVVARDQGPGIPNLPQIFAGAYRSRLGMGLGLRGVKQISDRFDIVTGPGKGTIVTFTMKVK